MLQLVKNVDLNLVIETDDQTDLSGEMLAAVVHAKSSKEKFMREEIEKVKRGSSNVSR